MGSMGIVHRRRNLAFGIVAAGTSIGGTVFPLIAGSLLPRVGYVFLFPLFEYFNPKYRFKWTMRIIAFILLALMIMANLACSLTLIRKYHSYESLVT